MHGHDGSARGAARGRMRDRAPRSQAADDLDAEVAAAEAEAHDAEAAVEHDIDAIEALVRERDELLDVSRRLQADFENYKKRMIREQTALVERATEGLVEQLLPVLDSFEAAFAQLAGAGAEAESVRKGVELVYTQLRDVLARAGLETVGEPGARFDPNEHEAVAQEPGDGEPVVSEVMRAGYRLKGRVLRPAMVKVTHGTGGDASPHED
jgi:molecular chaperone GrpE